MIKSILWDKITPTKKVSELVADDGGTSMTLEELEKKLSRERDKMPLYTFRNASQCLTRLLKFKDSKTDITHVTVGDILKIAKTLKQEDFNPSTIVKFRATVPWLVRFAGDEMESRQPRKPVLPSIKPDPANPQKNYNSFRMDESALEELLQSTKNSIYSEFIEGVKDDMRKTKEGKILIIEALQNEQRVAGKLHALQKAIEPLGWWARFSKVRNSFIVYRGNGKMFRNKKGALKNG